MAPTIPRPSIILLLAALQSLVATSGQAAAAGAGLVLRDAGMAANRVSQRSFGSLGLRGAPGGVSVGARQLALAGQEIALGKLSEAVPAAVLLTPGGHHRPWVAEPKPMRKQTVGVSARSPLAPALSTLHSSVKGAAEVAAGAVARDASVRGEGTQEGSVEDTSGELRPGARSHRLETSVSSDASHAGEGAAGKDVGVGAAWRFRGRRADASKAEQGANDVEAQGHAGEGGGAGGQWWVGEGRGRRSGGAEAYLLVHMRVFEDGRKFSQVLLSLNPKPHPYNPRP